MAPKRQGTRVTFDKTVKPSNDTRLPVKKRKKNSEEQTSGKRPRCNSPEDKDVSLRKRRNTSPLHAELLQQIEACLNVAEMSVLRRNKLSAIDSPQNPLPPLKHRLLKMCKDIRLPVSKVNMVKNLAKDLLVEQHRMKVYEDTLESLKYEIEEAVETAEKVEDAIETLGEKVEAMKEQALKTSQDQILSNIDPLELPQGTFEAPAMQDTARTLKNPKLMLKALTRVQLSPVYINALNLLQMSYAETSTL